MLLILLCGAWVSGIFLGSLFKLPFWVIFTGIIPLFVLVITRRYRKWVIAISLSAIAFFGGTIRYASGLNNDSVSQLQRYFGQEVEVVGVIANDPEVRDKNVHLDLSVAEIKSDAEWTKVKSKILLYAARNESYRYGDLIKVSGRLNIPDTLDDFDYRGYLANRGIYSVMSYPEIKVLERDKGCITLAWIYSLRGRLAQTLAEILPEPQAALAQGILLGMRGNIPQTLKDDFSHTGTAHILAISGQNLSIIAGILVSIGIWLFGRRHYIYIWLALGIIWLYTVLTGLSPPVIRASIMASLFLAAELFGRQRSAVPALALAVAVMIGISTSILRDASFQLSFLAMAGLIFIATPLQNLSRRAVGNTLGQHGFLPSAANLVLDSLVVTMGALIAVWPVIAYYFNIVSLVAPLTTLLIVPILPGIIIFSVLAAGSGMVFLLLGEIVGWVDWLFLSYFLLVVRVFAGLPISYIYFPYADSTFLIIYYVLLAVTIWLVAHQRQVQSRVGKVLESVRGLSVRLKMKWIVVPLLVIAILVMTAAATIPDNQLHVYFLDVGQGDAILIQRGNQQVLIDGGPSPQAINLELGKRMPFWDRTIEIVVMTHPDSDHLTGLVEVLKRYHVGQVLYPDFESDLPLYTQWLQLVDKKGIISTLAQAGQQINLGDDVEMSVLSPAIPPLFEAGSDDNGIVLRLSMGKVSFLFTADISWQAEFALITRRADLNSTVLKVAHHGSGSSTTAEFLSVVSPEVAVISVGKDNRYGHPTPETLARLDAGIGEKNVYRTDELGTIEFITNGQKSWMRRD